MTTREIQAHLEEIYQVDVSPALISSVTDAVIEEVKTWQNRPLEALYPILYLDALQVKVRDGAHIRNKAIYLAIGVNLSGIKEVLGLWVAQTEGAKFWLQIVTELKNRGVADIFIACVDGLKGFPEAIETVFPASAGAALYRASRAAQLELCRLEAAQGSRRGLAAYLPGGDTRRSWDETRRVRGSVGRAVPNHQPVVAVELGTHHAVLRLPGGHPPRHLYDQRHRVGEHVAAEDHQESRVVPDGRGGAQTALPGVTEHRAQMDDANQGMEGGAQSLRDSLRGQDACPLMTITYTNFWTRSF